MQQGWCQKQLELASDFGLPAYGGKIAVAADLLGILTRLKFDPRTVCTHLYYSSRTDLDACVAFGCYISISAELGIDQRGSHMRQLFRERRGLRGSFSGKGEALRTLGLP